MDSKVFVNLPVKDLEKSKEFFSKLGFSFNPKFTDMNAACMIISEQNYAMLLLEKFFQGFTKKKIANAKDTTEVLVALSQESREKVDQMLQKALTNGAVEAREKQDYGFMYGRSFEDLDGHIWEIFWMDDKVIHQS